MVSTQTKITEYEEVRIPRLSKEEMRIPIECEPEIIMMAQRIPQCMPIQATYTGEQSDEMKQAKDKIF